MKTKLIQKAKEFARECHKGQVRKDGINPYIKHPEAVVNLLLKVGVRDEKILASAWLHDVVEDCNITLNKIQEEFGLEVAKIVDILTRNCSRDEYKDRLKNSDFSVKIIKLADVIHNCFDYISKKRMADIHEIYFDLSKETYIDLYFILKKRVALKGGLRQNENQYA